jgi:threonine/homoserine/homoserine lactone efflux protein
MFDPGRLAAFAALTGFVSLVPGPNMLFVLGQAAWRRARGGALALAGLQVGNALWFVLAGLGLGTVLAASPLAFRGLTLLGALYLAWLGVQAWRHARRDGGEDPLTATPAQVSRHAFRDGILVALSNPKSLVYVAVLLPPFVDAKSPIAPQLALLAAVGIAIDVAIGLAYILAGSKLAKAMTRPALRRGIERGVGAMYLAIAAAVVVGLAR